MTKRRNGGMLGLGLAGLAGLSIAGCFSDATVPTGDDGGPAAADATVEDAALVEEAAGSVSVDSSPLVDATEAADATVAATDAADAALAATDAADAALAVTDAAPRTDASVDAAGATDAAIDAADSGAVCDGSSTGTHVLLTFDSNDPEFVRGVSWIDSTATTTANWSAYGGPTHCTDPQEFFGESMGAPEGALPNLVIGGHLATLACDSTVTTITSAPADCTSAAQLPVTTTYAFYGGGRADEVKISRTFGFDGSDAATPVYSGTTGLRPYVPRLPLGVFATVIYPNQAGSAVTSVAISTCPGDCLTPESSTWSGQWFADVAASGYAMIVLRDPSMTSPVDLTINYDSYSESNLSSFVLLQPTAGWQSPITEVEYMCFADLTTWPQSQRDAATLPTGCGL